MEAVQLVIPAMRVKDPYDRAIERARAVTAALGAQPRIDYAKANAVFRRQKAQLTRAVNSGDKRKIVAVVTAHVHEWRDEQIPWPDTWSTWQVALNDALPWNAGLDLRDL